MVAEEEVVVTLSGGAPWGFRLQGGTEQKRPLQVSKIRKRSKACRGGLWENDELVSINGKPCAGLSHAAAMQIIDSCNGLLSMVVKRIISGDLADGRLLRTPSPKQLQGNNSKVVSPAPLLGQVSQVRSPELTGPPVAPEPEQPPGRKQHMEHVTSPPDSEAYYAETDSDADNIAQEKHRRARKKSPRSPPEGSNNKVGETQDEVSMSELSGYDSTPEAVAQAGESGVAKREIVCQPESRTDTPFSESEALLQPPLLEDREASPEAMLLPHATKTIRAERHLIPMIGPVEHPVDEDLTTSYMEKAKQATMPQEGSKLNLGKKISVPRDVMLEELSLLTNRGSKMFKLRQLRVEKFIYENNPDVFIDNSVDHFQRFISSGHYGVDSHGYSQSGGRMVSGVTVGQYGSNKLHYPPAPPPKPGSKGGPGGTGAGGTGAGHTDGSAGTGGGVAGEGNDTAGGKGDNKGGSGKHVSIFKTYISPWERALGLTPQEKSQFKINFLSYGNKPDFCAYKSFNRTAMPYGGYEKASKLMTFQLPEFDAGPLVPEPVVVYNQEITNRPSFNRTPVPWQGSGEPAEYTIEVNVPMAGETEEL